MTKDDFAAMCGELLIDIGVALENESVCESLTSRDDEEVRRVLETEF